MKKMSIRARILSGVVIVNLLGAVVVMVYMHQSYQRSLIASTASTTAHSLAAWEILKGEGDIDPVAAPDTIFEIVGDMKSVTGADYGFLIYKDATDADEYAKMRESVNQPNNWDELENYALLAITDTSLIDRISFGVDPGSVPEAGKFVGIENGACTGTCHDGVTGNGDYWEVRWSEDSTSRTHAVFPVFGAGAAPVGAIYTIENISPQANTAKNTMMQTLLVIASTLLVATVVIGWLVDALVFKRLARTVASIQEISVRVAGGDFDARFVPDGTNDEIGSFEQFFGQLMDLVSSTLKSLVSKSRQ